MNKPIVHFCPIYCHDDDDDDNDDDYDDDYEENDSEDKVDAGKKGLKYGQIGQGQVALVPKQPFSPLIF